VERSCARKKLKQNSRDDGVTFRGGGGIFTSCSFLKTSNPLVSFPPQISIDLGAVVSIDLGAVVSVDLSAVVSFDLGAVVSVDLRAVRGLGRVHCDSEPQTTVNSSSDNTLEQMQQMPKTAAHSNVLGIKSRSTHYGKFLRLRRSSCLRQGLY
jgi:hypothetical protein